jgi:aminopeptidase-like protein
MRTKFGAYPEYHTSLDDLTNVVTPGGLEGGFNALWRAIEILEKNFYPRVTVLGEPQLGKRGLYPNLSIKGNYEETIIMMDFLTYADGSLSLLEIAELLETPCWNLFSLLEILEQHKLLELQDKSVLL